ncbi:MAG: RecX family transcriptional regulator [candidate division KSB1 bacterium]|nr:RecX family transcriptional regulator [candidate division KSB1 bacterium]
MTVTFEITGLVPQKKRKDRYSVFLDDEFAFGIHVDVLLKTGIAKGDRLDLEKIEEIQDLEEKRAAKDKALRLLGVRARSRSEMRQRLERSDFSKPVIEWTLKELDRLKLLDDTEFAKMFSRSRMVTKPVGAYYLRRELFQKGLSEKDIETGVNEAYRETDEATVARELAAKRKKMLKNKEEIKAKKRVSDFLQRRGFAFAIIHDVIDRWEEL